MQSGDIFSHQLSASSSADRNHTAEFGRLGNDSYWMSDESDTFPWFQVSFDEFMIITVIAIEIPGTRDEGWVQKFRIDYSGYGSSWKTYANLEDGESVSKNILLYNGY